MTSSRYESAYTEIRAILAARSQSSPVLQAKHIVRLLTCVPVPSLRTTRRFMEEIRSELAAAAKHRGDASGSLGPGFPKEFHMAAGEDKVDKILSHLENLHEEHDALKATCDAFGKRLDALEADKLKSDAEAKEEREKADKARRDAAVGPRCDESVETRNQAAAIQMNADRAYQAWNLGQAPHAVNGESLRDFRIRLLTPLKAHSKVYKDSDLTMIGDEAAFSNIEKLIVNDAVEASTTTVEHGAPLRKQVSRSESGHTVINWHGDPAVTWAPFMGGYTRIGRLVRPPAGTVPGFNG